MNHGHVFTHMQMIYFVQRIYIIGFRIPWCILWFQIKTWFQNRRMKEKRHDKETRHQMEPAHHGPPITVFQPTIYSYPVNHSISSHVNYMQIPSKHINQFAFNYQSKATNWNALYYVMMRLYHGNNIILKELFS